MRTQILRIVQSNGILAPALPERNPENTPGAPPRRPPAAATRWRQWRLLAAAARSKALRGVARPGQAAQDGIKLRLRDFPVQGPRGGRVGKAEGGFCYLTVKIGRKNFDIMKIRSYTIDAKDKRDMRRLHPDVAFDWRKITQQLAQKREVCRKYRSRRRRPRVQRQREPFYGVVDPITRTVYVNDTGNITAMGALLDAILLQHREPLGKSPSNDVR